MPRSRCSDTIKSRKEAVVVSETTDPFFNLFEKPTQIYRYLKTRFIASPLFLHRNLSYMKGRCMRRPSRNGFKMNDMYLKVQKKSENAFEKLASNENLIIGFICFDDQSLSKVKSVKVETKLEKISHKRRKEGTTGQNQILIGNSQVTVNSDENGTDKLPAVMVSNTEFDKLGENVQMTYQLTFDIISTNQDAMAKQYHAELPVSDKSGRNLLLNGLYHVTALESNSFRPSRMTCWESFASDTDKHIADWAEEVNKYYFTEEDSNPFTTFDKTPKIKLYMEWSRNEIVGNNYITRPKFINENNNSVAVANGNENGVEETKKSAVAVKSAEKSFIFQFVVNNSTKQRTEERSDFICPWCSLNCMRIYSLMKHLKLSHARLMFHYIEEGSKGRIDVYVNENYDGSYSGAPHDVLLGSQRGPTRRNVVTNIMVFRPRKPTYKMCEFQEQDDGELDQQRQYSSGHNRIYYHSETCIPILPKELDYDSEGEPDPKWLQRTTKQMIDEFTDVNDGEKELMKLWNLHIMKHGFVGDCQLKIACDLFVKEKGDELLEKNLYRNYIVHLGALFNYELISPADIYVNIQNLIDLSAKKFTPEHLKLQREGQVVQWKMNNPPETSTKSPSKAKVARSDSKISKSLPKISDEPATPKSKTNLKRKFSTMS